MQGFATFFFFLEQKDGNICVKFQVIIGLDLLITGVHEDLVCTACGFGFLPLCSKEIYLKIWPLWPAPLPHRAASKQRQSLISVSFRQLLRTHHSIS